MDVWSRVAVVAVLASGTLYADDWTKSFVVGASPELRVETDDGSVTIRTGTDRNIVAHVTTTGWKIGGGEVTVHESQVGDRVEVTVKIPHRPFTYSSRGRKIHLDLQVPKQLRTTVRTGDGAIDIQGVSGETRLHTGDGSIEAAAMDGLLQAESGDGHVRVEGRLDRLDLHTGDGAIEAKVMPGSRMNGGWHIESGDGGVTLRLPQKFAADLDLRSGDGGLTVDVPGMTEVSGSRKEHEMHGRLNGGGASLSVHTGDGSIHVRGI